MIVKLDKVTIDVARALEKFLGSQMENRTTVANWEYHNHIDPATQRVTDRWYTFEEEGGATPLVRVLEPLSFDQGTGFFRVTLEIHEVATPYRLESYDNRKNFRMLTLRKPFLRLLAVLGLFPEPPAEKKVEKGQPSYDAYALPAPVPLLAKPKEEKAADGKAAAPAQS